MKYLTESWATCRWRTFWNWCINWFAELDHSNHPAHSSCARLSWMFSTSASDRHSLRSISSDCPLVQTRWSIDLRPEQLSPVYQAITIASGFHGLFFTSSTDTLGFDCLGAHINSEAEFLPILFFVAWTGANRSRTDVTSFSIWSTNVSTSLYGLRTNEHSDEITTTTTVTQ